MDPTKFPLSLCIVECDGSACGSPDVGWHTHQPQDEGTPLGRMRVTEGRREWMGDRA